MPTMTNPNPCIGSAVLDNAPDGSALFRALGGHYTSPAQAVCEFIDDSLSSIAANGDEVGEVLLRVTDRGELVELSVTDSGSGIADLGAALTISDRSIAQTPYNEHGCGLKSALSHLCGGAEDWSIETRTADDAASDRYRCVSAPYAAVNAHMTERVYAGSGDIPWVTGTIVRLRCPMSRFAQLKPASRRTPADFCQLVDYLVEELRYTYAPLLASGQLILSILRCEQNGHEQLLSLDALEPEWDGDAVELPETKLDIGNGPVTVRCRYGLIIKSKSNAVYYKGNMASSGFEIRLNGRAVAHGLLGAVYGKATHPSGNRFLAQVDLLSGDGAALPPTETTKNAFVEADPRTQALYAFLRANVEPPKPPRHEPEKSLVEQLAAKLRAEPDVLRVSREVRTYRCIDLKSRIDLLVGRADGATIYEAKDEATSALDLYQLRLYLDGCAMDGVPVREGVLMACKHPREVIRLARQMNGWCDPTGKPYHITLRTWLQEGIGA